MKELRLPHSQIGGLFGKLFGGSSSSKSSSEEKKDETRTLDSRKVTDATQEEISTTELLSEEVRVSLEDLILDIAGDDKDVAGDISNIAEILLGRAEGAEEAINEASVALLDRARFEGTREVERLTAELSRGAGGGVASNSFVASATAEAGNALEIGLAGLSSELSITARDIGTQEFTNASQVFATGAGAGAAESSALAQLVEVIRGAKATSETKGALAQTEQVNATELLNSLITGSSETKGKSSDSLLKTLSLFK